MPKKKSIHDIYQEFIKKPYKAKRRKGKSNVKKNGKFT